MDPAWAEGLKALGVAGPMVLLLAWIAKTLWDKLQEVEKELKDTLKDTADFFKEMAERDKEQSHDDA